MRKKRKLTEKRACSEDRGNLEGYLKGGRGFYCDGNVELRRWKRAEKGQLKEWAHRRKIN